MHKKQRILLKKNLEVFKTLLTQLASYAAVQI